MVTSYIYVSPNRKIHKIQENTKYNSKKREQKQKEGKRNKSKRKKKGKNSQTRNQRRSKREERQNQRELGLRVHSSKGGGVRGLLVKLKPCYPVCHLDPTLIGSSNNITVTVVVAFPPPVPHPDTSSFLGPSHVTCTTPRRFLPVLLPHELFCSLHDSPVPHSPLDDRSSP